MLRYIALLRGINISGKNKISMPELKTALSEKGFADVKTYLNSGNVLFSDDETDIVKLAERIRAIIFETFHLEIPVFVISQDELKCLLSKAPSWWGSDSKDIYDNLIFAIDSNSIETVAEKIGEPTEKIEKVQICENVKFGFFFLFFPAFTDITPAGGA